ncbi:MAG: hypothetical protein J6O41_01045, partial [Clostridia bacterium]|nr:hypothetical protein [Clostridia bacterium]
NKEIINTQPEEKVFVSKNPEDIVNRAQREHIEEKNFEEPEVKEPIKRRRGRPRKEVTPPVEIEEKPVKRGRGRPRKNPISEKPKEEYIQETILPGFEDDIEEEPTNVSQNGPQFDNYENENKNIVEENTFLPGFNDVEENDDNEEYIDYNRNENYNDDDNNKVDEYENKDNYENFENNYDNNNYNNYNNYDNYNRNETVINPIIERNEEQYEEVDLSNLLTPDKKLVTFLGTSKNGTSFIVNNIAELMSSIGVDTAILDTTQNKNSYYIYTKNEEELRKVASKSIENLSIGEANGIKVHRNLTVYTSLPNELGAMNEADKILETLLKNHSLVLIDSDFDTPLRYFKQSQEIYLVQSMDILTIQPLTKFLRELKSKNILEERKLRIILNKNEKVRGIKNETIIGGMAFYNDPAMSYMTELFDRNMIKYITIPFDEEVYVNYLEALINCEISLRGYSKPFIQRLRELGNMIYPMVVMSTPDGGRRNRMKPNKANQQYQSYNNDAFSSNMNDTLNRMKNSFER